MKKKTVLETYEEKRGLVQEFNLTSDLFASILQEFRLVLQNKDISADCGVGQTFQAPKEGSRYHV